jgi:hypothetical protein
MPPREAQVLWGALARSRYRRPVHLRQQLALVGAVPMDFEYLLLKVLAPQELIAAIEDLCHERRLRRRQASRIEQYVLVQVTAEGH